MQILILNGSPRPKGNTKTALEAIAEGIKNNIKGAEIEFVDVAKLKIIGCVNCDACKKNGGICVQPDDSAMLAQKIIDAETIIFGSPVYWWGITAQLKLALDKLYSKSEVLKEHKKLIGLAIVGEAELENKEYAIIRQQFACICEYVGWNFIFAEAIQAWRIGEMAANTKKIAELKELWKKFPAA